MSCVNKILNLCSWTAFVRAVGCSVPSPCSGEGRTLAFHQVVVDVVPVEVHAQPGTSWQDDVPVIVKRVADRIQVRCWFFVVEIRAQQTTLKVLAYGLGRCAKNLAVGPAAAVHLALDSVRLRNCNHFLAGSNTAEIMVDTQHV